MGPVLDRGIDLEGQTGNGLDIKSVEQLAADKTGRMIQAGQNIFFVQFIIENTEEDRC